KGYWTHPKAKAARSSENRSKVERLGIATVITVSDRVSKGAATDKSGPLLAEGLREMGFQVAKPIVVPDETYRIAAAIRSAAAKSRVVALTGGTGLSPRDVTPEAVASVCTRMIPGIGEALRGSGGPVTAPLSRSSAGQLGECVIVSL